MQTAPQLRIKSVGHTDSTGSANLNQRLSVNRANSVLNYLASRGITSDRMTSEGRGFNDPIADNSTPEGRAQNRRVEVYLYAVQ